MPSLRRSEPDSSGATSSSSSVPSPPRTTAERVLPALEATSGLSRGEFGVAFCPERTSSGRAIEDIRGAYPKVVGGVDEESTRAAAKLVYETINDDGVIQVSDTAATAEAVKVFEGLYRDDATSHSPTNSRRSPTSSESMSEKPLTSLTRNPIVIFTTPDPASADTASLSIRTS